MHTPEELPTAYARRWEGVTVEDQPVAEEERLEREEAERIEQGDRWFAWITGGLLAAVSLAGVVTVWMAL